MRSSTLLPISSTSPAQPAFLFLSILMPMLPGKWVGTFPRAPDWQWRLAIVRPCSLKNVREPGSGWRIADKPVPQGAVKKAAELSTLNQTSVIPEKSTNPSRGIRSFAPDFTVWQQPFISNLISFMKGSVILGSERLPPLMKPTTPPIRSGLAAHPPEHDPAHAILSPETHQGE